MGEVPFDPPGHFPNIFVWGQREGGREGQLWPEQAFLGSWDFRGGTCRPALDGM